MDSEHAKCPSEEALAAIAAGGHAGAPEEHVAGCPNCRERVEALRSDELFARRFAGVMREIPGPLSSDQTPPEVPGYTIQGELSRGGQGLVYRAFQHETNRPVAIKTILRGVVASQREIARFEREVEIAASLRHPHIVTVFEARSLADGRHVLAMDRIDGPSLSVWAETAPLGREGLRARLTLVRDAARAVQYAHSKGVIHLDLKPANIVVDTEGAPHILDFGLARRGIQGIDQPRSDEGPATASGATTLTIAGVFQGTPAYAAPEQFEGDPSLVDVRADVYALGVILHELLTGTAAFADSKGNLSLIAANKRSRSLAPASASARLLGLSGVGADADAVIAKATAAGRDNRYPSASALADDLDALLRGEAVAARTGRVYRFAKLLRRHRVAAAAAVVVVLAALGGTAAVVASATSTKAAHERESLERDHSRVEGAKALAVAQILNELLPIDDEEFKAQRSPDRITLDRLHDSLNGGSLTDQPEVLIALHSLLARIYADRGVLGYAQVDLSRVVQLTTTIYGPEHPETAGALAQYAALLLQRGSLDLALNLARESLRIRSTRAGDSDPAVLAAHDLLARVLLAAGQVDEAAGHVETATTGTGELPDLPGALALRTLAEVRTRQGRSAEARDAAMRSLKALTRLLPDESPEITRGLRTLAAADAGHAHLAGLAAELDRTRPASRPAAVWKGWIAVKEELLGPRDDRVAQTYRTFAAILRDRRESPEAIVAIDHAMEIYAQTRGENSLVLAECLEDKYRMFNYYWTPTRDVPIQTLARRLDILRQTPDRPGDIWIAVAWREYAFELVIAGRFREAESALHEARDFALAHLGKSTESSRTLLILALVRYALEDAPGALTFARQAYDEGMFAQPGHDEMAAKKTVLGCCLAVAGEIEQASPFITEADARYFAVWMAIGDVVPNMLHDAASRFRAAGREPLAIILERAVAESNATPIRREAPPPR